MNDGLVIRQVIRRFCVEKAVSIVVKWTRRLAASLSMLPKLC